MNTFTTLLAAAVLLAPVASLAQEKAEITTADGRKTSPGPAENFTGEVAVSPLFPADHHSGTSGGHVTFQPGARSAWHTHPAGQTLVVTSGTGWVRDEGGTKREVHPGDVIWTPPGVKHWHGATSAEAMSHIAVTEVVDGRNVDWMEKVTDEQYAGR